MVKPVTFWNRIAKRYAKQPIADEDAYRKKLQVTRGYFQRNMNVLEFGCGTGSTAISHSPYVKHIRAIDISPNMLEIATTRARENDIDNITFERAAIESFQAPAASFDAVLGLSILHLLEDREAVIAKVYQLLKPGGIFVSSTVCAGNVHKVFRLILPIGKFFGVLPLVRFFSAEELQNNITNAGFRIDYKFQPGKDKASFIVALKP